MAFTTAQQAQIDRATDDREFDTSKLEKFTPDQLRAKVNILSVGGGVQWAPECDYTDAERADIEAALPRNKWAIAIPELLAEIAAMDAAGTHASVKNAILKGRR